MTVLRKRSEFVAASHARRWNAPAFGVQARDRGDDGGLRVGFTCSKKVGNAVARNRAKRRLRALARIVLPVAGRAGWDYVLIGRPEVTAIADFAAMQGDLAQALERLHKARG